MGVGKNFCIHLGDLGSRSLNYRCGTQFTLPNDRYKLGIYIPLIMFSAWLNFGEILPIFSDFFRQILNLFSPVEPSICHILGMVCPIDVKQKENESTGCCADWNSFDRDLWHRLFKVKLYLGNGGPDCHGTKGTKGTMSGWAIDT